MDAIDRKILAVVQQDASLSVAEIGQRVGLSSTPCWKRLQRLEAEGVITRRVAIIDPDKVGLGITVFVSIETGDHSQDWLKKFADVGRRHAGSDGVLPDGRRRRLHVARGRGRHCGLRRVLQKADRDGAVEERHVAIRDGADKIDDCVADRRNAIASAGQTHLVAPYCGAVIRGAMYITSDSVMPEAEMWLKPGLKPVTGIY